MNNYNTFLHDCQEQFAAIDNYMQHAAKSASRTKQLSQIYDELYTRTKAKKYANLKENTANCRDYALFRHFHDPSNTTKLLRLNRCKNKFCVFCNWIDSKKRFQQLAAAVALLQAKNVQLRHFVITTPNCELSELRDKIDFLHKTTAAAVRHFGAAGYYRQTEISYNPNTRTYHPHTHILIPKYIKIHDFVTFVTRKYNARYQTDYDNIICYAKHAGNYIHECCKYIMKPDELTYEALQELIELDILKGLRQCSSSGIIKKAINFSKISLSMTAAAELQELYNYDFEDIHININTGKIYQKKVKNGANARAAALTP